MSHDWALKGAKDKTEEEELKFIWKQQDMANTILKEITGTLGKEAKDLAPYMPPSEDRDLGLDASEEFEIHHYRILKQTRPTAAN